MLLDGELPTSLETAQIALINRVRIDLVGVVVIGEMLLHNESTAMLEKTNRASEVVERDERGGLGGGGLNRRQILLWDVDG